MAAVLTAASAMLMVQTSRVSSGWLMPCWRRELFERARWKCARADFLRLIVMMDCGD